MRAKIRLFANTLSNLSTPTTELRITDKLLMYLIVVSGCSIEILFEKGKHFLPAIHRLFLSIAWAMIVEKAMTGIIIAVELIRFAVLLQFRFVLVDLLRCGAVVVVAKEAQEGTREVGGVVQRAHRVFRGQVLRGHHHAPTPAIDHRVEALDAAAR